MKSSGRITVKRRAVAAYTAIPASSSGSSGTDWYAVEAAAMTAAIPALTSAVAGVAGRSEAFLALNGTNTADAGKEGGALTGKASAWNRFQQATVWQNLQSSKFAISMQFIATNTGILCGAIDAAGAHGLFVDVNTKIAGHYVLYGIGTSGNTSNVDLGATDSTVHTWRIFSDGTTVTAYKDGVSAGTMLTSATNFPTQACMPGFSSGTGSDLAIYKCLWGYVGV